MREIVRGNTWEGLTKCKFVVIGCAKATFENWIFFICIKFHKCARIILILCCYVIREFFLKTTNYLHWLNYMEIIFHRKKRKEKKIIFRGINTLRICNRLIWWDLKSVKKFQYNLRLETYFYEQCSNIYIYIYIYIYIKTL